MHGITNNPQLGADHTFRATPVRERERGLLLFVGADRLPPFPSASSPLVPRMKYAGLRLVALLPPNTHSPTKTNWYLAVHISQFQRGLILGHVELLEPRWKDNPGPMRIFTAPIGTEVEVARNMHDLVKVLGPGKGKDVKVCDRLKFQLYQTCPVPAIKANGGRISYRAGFTSDAVPGTLLMSKCWCGDCSSKAVSVREVRGETIRDSARIYGRFKAVLQRGMSQTALTAQ